MAEVEANTTNDEILTPTGGKFVIGQVDFDNDLSGHLAAEFEGVVPEDRIQSWPMVYVLSNEKEAYVGQTTSVSRRMAQHGMNPHKKKFKTASVIYNDEFNASVVTDYEHRLIDLMQGDERFRLTNRNGGQSPTNYFSRDAYARMFDQLWNELRDMNLVRNSIEEIEQSAAFKFSPFKVLNADQEVALQEILEAIDKRLKDPDDTKCTPIVVQGMPGTGKTVLAISLLKMLKDLAGDKDPGHAHFHGVNVKLLEPVTGLRKTIQRALRKTVNLKGSDVIGPNDIAKAKNGFAKGKRGFDVVLVDEAHNLGLRKNMPPLQFTYYDDVTDELGLPHGASQLDWILSQSRIPIFFYDPLQSIGPKGVGDAYMRERLGRAMEKPMELRSQMRVKGGEGYLEHIRAILYGEKPKPRSFESYELVLHKDFAEFEQHFEETLAEHSLTRMIAGYAWPWLTKGKKPSASFDIELDGVKKRWNRTFRDWVGRGFSNDAIAREVGCIHSIQGYDLTHAFVIIGNDLRFDEKSKRIVVDKASYWDRNGKNNATDEDLDRYIRNIYYVLLTRGIESTHVYVCDKALRKYLSRYIPAF